MRCCPLTRVSPGKEKRCTHPSSLPPPGPRMVYSPPSFGERHLRSKKGRPTTGLREFVSPTPVSSVHFVAICYDGVLRPTRWRRDFHTPLGPHNRRRSPWRDRFPKGSGPTLRTVTETGVCIRTSGGASHRLSTTLPSPPHLGPHDTRRVGLEGEDL